MKHYLFIRSIAIYAVMLITLFCTNICLCQTNVELMLEQNPVNGGTISPGTGIHQFKSNSQISLTAVAQDGFCFAYWLGDVSNPTSSTTNVKMDSTKAIVAVFKPVTKKYSDPDQIHLSGGSNAQAGQSSMIPSAADLFFSSFPAAGSGVQIKPKTNFNTSLPASVPEPATIILLALGTAAFSAKKRKN